MFQFPSLPLRTLFYSGASITALPVMGFPIRKSRGQRLVSTSPELIAAAHVLLRLLAPRHPPCALSLLIVKNSYCCYGVFKVRAERSPLLCTPMPDWEVCDRRARKTSQKPVSQNSAARRMSRSTLI